MASSYTSSLGLVLPVQGELSGTWGDTVNNYLTTYVDTAVAGQLAISLTGNLTLTKSTGTSLGSTSSQYAILNVTPSASTWTITVPAASQIYHINNLSSTYTFAFKASGGTAITVAAAEKCVVAYNGSNFVRVSSTSIFGSPSTAMTLDTSGNLGLGVTPTSAWSGGNGVIEFVRGGHISNEGGSTLYIGNNNYFDGTDLRYKVAGPAAISLYGVGQGTHIWYNSVAGTAGNIATPIQAMTLDSSGNLGLGVTPSAGGLSTYRLFEIGTTNNASIYGGNNQILIGTNIAWVGSTPNYKGPSAIPGLYNQQNGVHTWSTAPSGTAGNPITFTQTMTLDASGNLVIGNTVANERLDIYKSNTYNADPALYFRMGTNDTAVNNNVAYAWRTGITGSATGYGYVFQTLARTEVSWVERARIDASGNFGLGTTAPTTFGLGGKNLEVDGTTGGYAFLHARTSTVRSFFAVNEGSALAALFNYTSHPLTFGTNNTERMRLDASGDLLVGTSSGIGVGAKANIYGGGNVLHVQSTSGAANNIVSYNSGGTATFSVSNGGAVSKTSGSFRIEHPLPQLTATHDLVHSFIEGPQADLIYRGKVTLVEGKASVNIDQASGMTNGTFVVLCRDVQCFTTNESDWTPVRGSVTGNILTIEAQDNTSTSSISWMVIGERQDKHMIETDWTDSVGKVIVEPLKRATV